MLGGLINNPVEFILLALLGIASMHAGYSYIAGKGSVIYEAVKLRWTYVEAITVTVAVYFWSQVLAAIPLLVMFGEKALNQDTVAVKFATVLAIDLMALGMLFLFLRRRGAKAADIGLKPPRLSDAGHVLVGYGVYIVLYLLLVQLLSSLPGLDVDQKQELGFSPGIGGSSLVLVFVSLVILPPILEEIIMRGFLYTGLRSKFTMLKAGIITSILFAAAHLQAGSGNALLWIAAIDTFVLSMVLVYLREKTGSLAAPIGLHMLKNGIAFAALFILKLT